mgnify:CR=1 FL=1
MWGKLASEILTLNWDQAVEDIQALRDAIEARANSPALALMQQRRWLMHWALFVLGNHYSYHRLPKIGVRNTDHRTLQDAL